MKGVVVRVTTFPPSFSVLIMSTIVNIEDVKIKQSIKDIVFGYIRNTYIFNYNIPPLIIYWCLLYYYEKKEAIIIIYFWT